VGSTGQKKPTLSAILVDSGIVTNEQVDAAFQRQLATGRMMGETLVELGFTTEENIGWALSKQLGIPYADVQPAAIDPELVKRFPEALLRRIQATPLFRGQGEIAIAMADPTDPEAVAELREAAGVELSLVIGCPASIRAVLNEVYGPERVSSEREASWDDEASESVVRRIEQSEEGAGPRVVWDRSGTTFLLYHVHAARQVKASQVHFVPGPGGLTVFYRTDQGLERHGLEQPETGLYLRTRLAHLGAPDLEVTGGPIVAWGSVRVTVTGERIHIGVCHCRSDIGITTVLRMNPESETVPDLSALGLSPIGEAEIRDFVEGPEGLVIVHGPPRSGGSTVLASLAALAARPTRRIVVFEPWRLTAYPSGTTRIQVVDNPQFASDWGRVAVGLGADIVVLDDVLTGDAMRDVLTGATVGRLVFVRTDWLDGRRLIQYLAKSSNGRAVLRDRPLAMISLPAARREGSGVWTTPAESDAHAGLLQTMVLSDEERDALGRQED